MAKDILYIYDKVLHNGYELGEIQSDFNISLVIDGTKDSMKVICYNFDETEIEPYSIVQHKNTGTWWVVSHDKVTRYANDLFFRYSHELELLGAIEILNARDLTDCGYNQNKYDVDTFIKRLFALSTFEFNNTDYNSNVTNLYINYGGNLSPIKLVDYLKSYENYTLLSALRDFLDGYNCVAKLEFITDNSNRVVSTLVY